MRQFAKKGLTNLHFQDIIDKVADALPVNCNLFSEDMRMFETLKNLLVEELQLNADDITMESELANDLGINSIELADLIMLCEDKFGVTIEDEDIHKFVTVADVVAYLEEHAK